MKCVHETLFFIMLLKRFALPKTDVRMVTIDNKLFKIGIHLVKHPNRNEKSYEEFCSNPKHQEEIEKIMIVLLTAKSHLRPIKTDNLTVYPYQREWKFAPVLKFYRHGRPLETCPFETHFYIEPKMSRNHHVETSLKQCTAVQNMTRHAECRSQACQSTSQERKTQNDARTVAEIKSKSQDKTVEKHDDKMQAPKIGKNKEIVFQSELVKKCKFGNSSKVFDESESESEDNQSVSILNGIQCCDVSSPEDVGPGTLSSSGDESSVYLTARNEVASSETEKQDMRAEKMKLCKPIKLISASATIGQTRKRHGDVLDEALPKKKNYSVTEYLDTNRHAVQEQELQELLRFQHLATPADEKPAAMEERRPANIQQVFCSVRKLVFG